MVYVCVYRYCGSESDDANIVRFIHMILIEDIMRGGDRVLTVLICWINVTNASGRRNKKTHTRQQQQQIQNNKIYLEKKYIFNPTNAQQSNGNEVRWIRIKNLYKRLIFHSLSLSSLSLKYAIFQLFSQQFCLRNNWFLFNCEMCFCFFSGTSSLVSLYMCGSLSTIFIIYIFWAHWCLLCVFKYTSRQFTYNWVENLIWRFALRFHTQSVE